MCFTGLDYDCRAYGCAHGGTCNPADGFCEDCDNEDLRNSFIQGNNCVFQDKCKFYNTNNITNITVLKLIH